MVAAGGLGTSGEMLKQRILNGLMLGVALAAAMLFARGWGAIAVFVGLAIVAHREFYRMLDAANIPSFKVIGTLVGVGLVSTVWGTLSATGDSSRSEEMFVLALALGFFVIFARQFHQKFNPRPLETMAGTLMGVMYIGFLLSFFVRLVYAWGSSPDSRALLLYMIVIVKCGDIGAFFTGRSLGRHKLIPRISPAKSWEGCIGGVAMAITVSLAVAGALRWVVGPVAVPPIHAAIIGALLGVTGILGDLAESLLKRAAGVKDSGTILPGLGGWLDVLDSLLPAAPVLYVYARFVLLPAGAP